MPISGRDVAHGADVHLAAWQEGHGAREVDREAAFDATEDRARDTLGLLEGFLELLPGFLAAGLFTGQNDFAVHIFIAFDEDFHLVAHGDLGGLSRRCEFLERDATFGLQSDIDQRVITVDRNNGAFDNRTFER